MEELAAAGGEACATDQILYNLSRRGSEHDLLPWLKDHVMPAMAYSPVEQGRQLADPTLAEIAHSMGATPGQVALAWTMRHDGVIAIPKTGAAAHAQVNRAAADLVLPQDVLARLDQAFPGHKTAVRSRCCESALALFFTADTHVGDHRTINIRRRPIATVVAPDLRRRRPPLFGDRHVAVLVGKADTASRLLAATAKCQQRPACGHSGIGRRALEAVVRS